MVQAGKKFALFVDISGLELLGRIFPEFTWWKKSLKTSKSVYGAPAKIRFAQLPNTSLECKLYTILLDNSHDKSMNV